MKRRRLYFIWIVVLTGVVILAVFHKSEPQAQRARAASRKAANKRTLSAHAKNAPSSADLEKLWGFIDVLEDGQLNKKELTWAVQKRNKQHMQKSIQSNMKSFFSLDKVNPNGLVGWEEWLQRFTSRYDSGEQEARLFKETLSAAKASWSEAARSNPDQLNIDEFLAFNHPELSQPLIMQEVEAILNLYDANGDGLISAAEGLEVRALGMDETSDSASSVFALLDANDDSQLDRRELLAFFDPKTEIWASLRAAEVLASLDENEDQVVQWEEFLRADAESLKVFWPQKYFHEVF